MGQGASGAAVGGGFGALWEALGEDTRAQIGALAQKECDALLTPHGGAPAATPQLPVKREREGGRGGGGERGGG